MSNRKIILASGSPRRKKLLEQIGLKFEIRKSEYEEDMTLDLSPGELVKFLALNKAKDVARHYDDAIIIGSDTIVVYDNKVLGKPKDENDAFDTLAKLSGQTHTVYTGIAIIDIKNNKTVNDFDKTEVQFRNYNKNEINDYIATGEPLDKAGAYGIQEKGAALVKSIKGDHNTVIGLPIRKIYLELKKLGVNSFKIS